jgi:hypothetical protein
VGIHVQRESEDREVLEQVLDPGGLTQRILPEKDGRASLCLRFVDPYGDTCFNQLQIPHLAEELGIAAASLPDGAARNHAMAVLRLVQSAQGDPHVYVWFIGD